MISDLTVFIADSKSALEIYLEVNALFILLLDRIGPVIEVGIGESGFPDISNLSILNMSKYNQIYKSSSKEANANLVNLINGRLSLHKY